MMKRLMWLLAAVVILGCSGGGAYCNARNQPWSTLSDVDQARGYLAWLPAQQDDESIAIYDCAVTASTCDSSGHCLPLDPKTIGLMFEQYLSAKELRDALGTKIDFADMADIHQVAATRAGTDGIPRMPWSNVANGRTLQVLGVSCRERVWLDPPEEWGVCP